MESHGIVIRDEMAEEFRVFQFFKLKSNSPGSSST